MKIDLIAGARPNFMKISPIINALKKLRERNQSISYRLIHTGQHYDQNMSGSFFEQLGIPLPDHNLGAGGGTQAEQTGNIMLGYEKLLLSENTDLCLVVGDVTSTLACSITAKKLGVKVAHVEGGIRSGDMSMPEEINRIVTDSISDLFFTTSRKANENLIKEGKLPEQIHFVGNTMIDTLLNHRSKFQKPEIWDEVSLEKESYIVITLHRPANVDQEVTLKSLIESILESSRGIPIIFPVHPRTRKALDKLNIEAPNFYMIDPLGYLEFNFLVENCKAVITDSGGITEETTVLGIPCMTLRENTERPETITEGTNELLGLDPRAIAPNMMKLFEGKWKKGNIPELWDGYAAERIAKILTTL